MNVPLCTATGAQEWNASISDGAGGAFVVWQDSRSGTSDIYAQRVSAGGVALWAADGVALCTATGAQQYPTIVLDSGGGAIVSWQDIRSGTGDIYAQRISADGTVQWPANGVALCVATGDQANPTIVSDGAGGAIVTWQDPRSGKADIYAQRISPGGASQWTTDGVALCTAASNQHGPTIASDGAGGAIITWYDWRNGTYDIYAQRVSPGGAAQWTTNGVALCTAAVDQYSPTIVSDGAGGAIVTWYDMRSDILNPDIYAQRISATGAVQWTADGVALSTATGSQQYPTITSDGAGGAIVTWTHWGGDAPGGIHAQRISAGGTPQWTINGVALSTATGDQQYPTIVSDDAGGAIVTWYDHRSSNYDIYAQKISAAGAVQWTANGVALCTATGDQEYPIITSDGAGGAIATWSDYRSGTSDIYAQRVDAAGYVGGSEALLAPATWPTDPLVNVPVCAASGDQQYPAIAVDGTGGAIIAWEDSRPASSTDVYVRRVSAGGAVLWTTDGVAVGSGDGYQYNPLCVSDGAGGAIVTWNDSRSGDDNEDIYAQQISGDGTVLWTANGVALCTVTGHQHIPTIVSDGAGGAIVTWMDQRSGNWDIYAQWISAGGTVQWAADGVALCTVTGDQYYPRIVSDGAGGAIVTWMDQRSGNWDIYAQWISAAGTVQWAADGVALCTVTGNQYHPRIVSNGAGGAIVTWMDQRSGNWDIYVQRISAAGAVQWTADGVPLCTAADNQYNPEAVSDGTGGAIVAWWDRRSGTTNAFADIYAQRVSASGAVQWTADGVALCTAIGGQVWPAIASDGAGGAIVTWWDTRIPDDRDIYAQRISAGGAVQWTADGVAVCTATGYQQDPMIVSDGASGAIVTWTDFRSGTSDIYAQRIDAAGQLGGSAATCITPAHPCVAVPVTISRITAENVRGFTVTIQLSGGLALCGAGIAEGTYLSSIGGTIYEVVDNGGGSYTVDGAILGLPCGATAASGTLFTVNVGSAATSGTGTVTLTGSELRDCDNAALASSLGGAASITIDNSVPAGITALAASQLRSGNDTDGTTKLTVSWPAVEAGTTVHVYRADYGGYPEYDDLGGVVPAVPVVHPPVAPWVHAADVTSGTTLVDEVAWPDRGFWYYVAYVEDECGNVSPVSNMTAGTLNYHLGDVMASVECAGNNAVDIQDISLLGGHYAVAEGHALYLACLDVGATTSHHVDGRPLTDNKINFEDMMMFAINYGPASASLTTLPVAAVASDAVWVEGPAKVTAGQTFTVSLRMSGSGALLGLSAALGWDRAVAELVSIEAGELVTSQGGVALSGGGGLVDCALLGADRRLAGEGDLARVTFRALANGAPQVALAAVDARDAANRMVELTGTPPTVVPAVTSFAPAMPNPFHGTTTLSYALAKGGAVELAVYGVDGRKVATLASGVQEAGSYRLTWDGGNARPGLYYARLTTPQGKFTRTLVLVK